MDKVLTLRELLHLLTDENASMDAPIYVEFYDPEGAEGIRFAITGIKNNTLALGTAEVVRS